VDRPARTFVLPVPLSRMLAAYTLIRESGPNIGTRIFIPVTNPIEHLNKEVKRRADVVGIFPNEASIMRLIGAVLFDQNDEWQTSSRYMMVEAFAQIDKEEIDPILSTTTKAA
jgi:hypothetical protein